MIKGDKKSINERLRIVNISDVYNSEILSGPNEEFHKYIRDSLIPKAGGHSALELGCGVGLWTMVLCDLYDNLDVVEGSKELLENVLKKCKGKAKILPHHSLVEDFLRNSKQTWQHVFLTFLLEHLEDPVFVLRQLRSRIEKNGLLFLAVPNANSIHRVLAFRAGLIKSVDELSANDILLGHRRVYTNMLLKQHLFETGYQIDKEIPIGFKPLTLKQLVNLPSPVIAALCESGDLVPENSAYIGIIARP